jgi:hypothetical protein
MAVVMGAAAFLLFSRDSAQTALEETRRALRQQGFKIDLAEFNLSASAESRVRAAALTNADLLSSAFRGADPARRTVTLREGRDLLPSVGSNAALVVRNHEKLPPPSGPNPWLARNQLEEDLWPALRETFNEERSVLDAACDAAISGHIRFDLAAWHGTAMLLLTYHAALRNVTQILGTRAALELHDGNRDAAWTNLLASTRLITAWDSEPTEVSLVVRCSCTTLAYDATWQALQADGWADDRLAILQHEWESVDFLRGLPEAEAFGRAVGADVCQRDRREPLGPSSILRDMVRSPGNALRDLADRWDRIRHRHHGSYDEERALLLHYRDRELQMRRAVQASTWAEIRLLPAVTNVLPFQFKYHASMWALVNPAVTNVVAFQSENRSRVQALLKMRQTQLHVASRGQGLLGIAAEAEARRRILIAAIALERYRGRHGGYPKALQELVPELLQTPPVDFMDGKPLRYQLTDDGHFVLYSVGLDCVDDGGNLRRPGRRDLYGAPSYDAPVAIDLVWPRPASAVEIQAQQAEDEKQAERERAALQERQTKAKQ